MKKTRATPSLIEIVARGTYYGILVLAVSLALITLGVPANVILGTIAIIIIAAVALCDNFSVYDAHRLSLLHPRT